MGRYAWDDQSVEGKLLRYNISKLQRRIKKLLNSEDESSIEKVARLMHIQTLLIKTKTDIINSNLDKHKIAILEAHERLEHSRTQPRRPLPRGIRHEVLLRDKFSCVECGLNNTQIVLHVDHIIPVSQGGSDELSNLRTLCVNCNLEKSSMAHSQNIQLLEKLK